MATRKAAFLLLLVLVLACGSASRLFAQTMLRPGDIVEIRLAGVPAQEIQAFSAQYQVDDSGMLNLPYINQVHAAGLPTNQVQAAIEEKLKADGIYTHPSVTVIPIVGGRFVNVGGAVRAPGRVPYTPDLTLMSAVFAAGGPSDFAGDKIRVTRKGEVKVFSRKRLSKYPNEDFPVMPGDQIEVLQGGILGF
jgi:protein involved in polysaccharide export with SLBB domain